MKVSLLALLAAVGSGRLLSGDNTQNGLQPQADQPQILTRWLIGHKKGGAHRSALKDAIEALGGRVHREFTLVDAVAVEMDAHLVEELREHALVRYVEEDAIRKPMAETTPWGVTAVNAESVWNATTNVATKGEGAVVCVIDGGLYWQHEDFQGLDIVNQNDQGEWNWTGCNHGTHVSGTIGAVTGNGIGVASVAPGASQYIVRVFENDACDWTYSSGLVAAAEECIAGGSNIISMSLGGSSYSQTEDEGFQAAWDANVFSIAAAGNAGNTAYSYPASYDSVMSVAAVDEYLYIASFSQQNDQVEIAGPGVDVLSTIAGSTIEQVTILKDSLAYEFEAFALGGSAWGNVTGTVLNMNNTCDPAQGHWAGVDATDMIVHCHRGDVSFYSKVAGAINASAIAVIISNNRAGAPTGLTVGVDVSIPVVGIYQADGETIDGLAMPFGNVELGNIPAYSSYVAWSGTSMATPHVSAVAALLWSAKPDAGAAKIRQCMTETALDLGTQGRDNAFGYGFVQADAAHECVFSVPYENKDGCNYVVVDGRPWAFDRCLQTANDTDAVRYSFSSCNGSDTNVAVEMFANLHECYADNATSIGAASFTDIECDGWRGDACAVTSLGYELTSETDCLNTVDAYDGVEEDYRQDYVLETCVKNNDDESSYVLECNENTGELMFIVFDGMRCDTLRRTYNVSFTDGCGSLFDEGYWVTDCNVSSGFYGTQNPTAAPTTNPTPSPIPMYYESCVDSVGSFDTDGSDVNVVATLSVDAETASMISSLADARLFVSTRMNHTYLSDVTIALLHGGERAMLIDGECGSQRDLSVIFSDDGVYGLEDFCYADDHWYGNWHEVYPMDAFSVFSALDLSGEWTVQFNDTYPGLDGGSIGETCIGWRSEATHYPTSSPTDTPTSASVVSMPTTTPTATQANPPTSAPVVSMSTTTPTAYPTMNTMDNTFLNDTNNEDNGDGSDGEDGSNAARVSLVVVALTVIVGAVVF